MEIILWIVNILLGILFLKIAYIVLYFLFIFAASFFIDKRKEYDRESHFYRFLLWSSTFLGLKITRVKLECEGFDKIPEGKRMLFVSNHRSNYDPLVGWYVFRKNHPAYISKESNFNVPFYGRMIKRCCFMAIDRENPRNAMKTIDRASKLLIADEVSIAVYPEGTRSKDCKLLPFHSGVFKIAQKANVPIVVTTIQGTEKVSKNYPWRSTRVRVNVVKVIDADYVKSSKTSDISEEIRSLIEKDIEENKI